jgi:hypothetical protein
VARIEDLLRDEFGRGDTPAGPGRDAMLSRVTRVRRLRMAGAATGGLAAVTAVTLAAVSLAEPHLGGNRAGGDLPQRDYSIEAINTLFTDRQHGYEAQQWCSMDVPGQVPDGAPTPDIHQQCTTLLLVTDDSGQSWHARPVPGDPATKDAGVELQPGHSLMLWTDGQGRLAYGGWNRKYWTTADGGISWQESPTQRDIGPNGSMGTFGPGDTLTFLATAPPDGIATKKTTHNPAVPASDGSFWTACTPDPCVRVTRDHGATWQPMSTVDGVTTVDWVATTDGRTVFAAAREPAGPRLLRSVDGGVTWTVVLDLPQQSGEGVALPDGDLILSLASEQGGTYRLRSGASSLERLADAPAHPDALYVSGGVVVAADGWEQSDDPRLGSVVSVSPDGGTTWSAVPATP